MLCVRLHNIYITLVSITFPTLAKSRLLHLIIGLRGDILGVLGVILGLGDVIIGLRGDIFGVLGVILISFISLTSPQNRSNSTGPA